VRVHYFEHEVRYKWRRPPSDRARGDPARRAAGLRPPIATAADSASKTIAPRALSPATAVVRKRGVDGPLCLLGDAVLTVDATACDVQRRLA